VSEESHLAELRRQAQYRRERLEIYRAKVYGPRPTSPAKLEELEREYELATSRLRRAEQAADQAERDRADAATSAP
jgi:hypothetical protein